MKLVLASGSAARQSLLRNAGIPFEIEPAAIDERAVEEPLLAAGVPLPDVAVTLASAKAVAVSAARPDALVIGADQILDLGGERFTKPADTDAARDQLRKLAGRPHQLHSACVCAFARKPAWRTVDTARLFMRALDDAAIDRHIALSGPGVLASVGSYQLEGPGIQLFERIEGDYFTILGLPLLPLLAYLRSVGALQ